MKDKQAERQAFFDFYKNEKEQKEKEQEKQKHDTGRERNNTTKAEVEKLSNERPETRGTDRLLQADLLCGV